MTIKVNRDIYSITMDNLSTITQKGQVVIPIAIRNQLHLKPATRVFFEVKDNAVVMRPSLTINQVFGIIKTKKRYIKKDYKKAIQEAVLEKFIKKQI